MTYEIDATTVMLIVFFVGVGCGWVCRWLVAEETPAMKLRPDGTTKPDDWT